MAVSLSKVVEKTDKKEARLIKAMVFKARTDKEEEAIDGIEGVAHTQSLPEDPFEALEDQVVKPPYDPLALARIAEYSVALSANIETMEANIPGFGHTLMTVFPQSIPPDLVDDVALEGLRLENDLATFGREVSLTKLRRNLRRDLEKTGNAYLEAIKNPKTNRWVAGRRIKSYRMRLLKQDDFFTEYTLYAPQSQENSVIDYIPIPHAKRFRRYVEAISYSDEPTSGESTSSTLKIKHRFYKEYGDPRVVDNQTGEYVSEKDQEKFGDTGKPMPESRKASEIIHFGDSDRSPYGVPRWASAIVSALGGRSAELVNLYTLQNHGIPSMVVTVSNGRLTESTVKRIQEFVDNHVKGDANYSTFLVLEGEGEFDGDESNPTKIQITPLADTQIRDMLFGDYLANNEARIDKSFRLPPIYSGQVGQYNRATADISRRLADEQVFAPERDEEDWWFNNVLFVDWRVKYHKYRTNTPNVTDNKDLIAMATALERTGGMTPRIARRIGREVFPQVSQLLSRFKEEEVDPDVPFSITLAKAVQNLGIANEPNQQMAPVLPSADPNEAIKHVSKHFGELEEAAITELRRFFQMEDEEED